MINCGPLFSSPVLLGGYIYTTVSVLSSTPLYILEFAQDARPINLIHFFITFFACFFALLVLAYIGWRVRVRYEVRIVDYFGDE